MRHSDIFESFIKIAQEKGMISEDAPEKAIKKLEQNPRADSLSVEDIGKLYNVKPDLPKDMQYDKNIIEDAHPDPLVISPAHDKLNGLIENENERQNITLNILNKTPNGHLTQHKYAEKQLLLTLVRLGNDLDNKDKDNLRKLADTCLEQVSQKNITKQAVPALGIALAGIPILLGALYVQQHVRFADEGFKINNQKLINEIDDLIASNADYGVGYKYRPEFVQQMQDFKTQLTDLYNTYEQSVPIIDELEKPRNAKELIAVAQRPETSSVTQAYKALRNKIAKITPYIKKVITDFSSEGYKQRQIEEKGFLSGLVDKTQVLHGGKGLVADDFDDVVRALGAYRVSLANVIKVLRGANSVEQSAARELSESAGEFAQEYGNSAPEPGAAPQNPNLKEIEDRVMQLEQEMRSA